MSNHTASLQKAIDILGEAIREDQDSNWEKAVELYNRALESFMHHIKYEKNAQAKEMIEMRVKKYTDRAEQIKKLIDERKKSKKKQKASANGDEVDNASLQKAIDILGEAIREDQDSNWEKAVELYNRALESFMHHIKYEKNAKARVMIYIRVKKYTDRAEQIKKIIDEGKKSKKKQKASANGDEVDKKVYFDEQIFINLLFASAFIGFVLSTRFFRS